MCGITGFFESSKALSRERMLGRVREMTESLHHRGPDAQGTWCDPAAGVALGFRRLAILDLAPTGNQPMTSAEGRYTIVFNGEIYNFRELRRQLEGLGHGFRGHSDTEVILAAASQWGAEGAVTRLHGMFAIALWDAAERELMLARDRIGIKPLYYGRSGGAFLFASELKACRRYPGFRETISPQGMAQFLQYGYVSSPYSIFADMWKLSPGCLLRVASNGEIVGPKAYWSLASAINHRADAAGASAPELVTELDALLRRAVERHMVADVPIGAFLSGGIDSSTVVALMQAQSPRPVETFTIGFHEQEFDEAVYARQVAERLGTRHTEVYLGYDDALAVIPRMAQIYDEPFADSSQVPTFLVSQVARKSVTVVLSGDGGDELFAGYNRYLNGPRIWRMIEHVPLSARHAVGRALTALPAGARRTVSDLLGPAFRSFGAGAASGETLEKAAQLLSMRRPDELYSRLCSLGTTGAGMMRDSRPAAIPPHQQPPAGSDFVGRMQYYDLLTYLPDDILVKVDRASMAVSLEARVPLLDDEVIDFAAGLPTTAKIAGGETKHILRGVLERYLPRTLFERRKAGFAMPLGNWLRGPLRDWAEPLLLREHELLDGVTVRRLWAQHLQGGRLQYELWAVLMLQAWQQESRPPLAAAI